MTATMPARPSASREIPVRRLGVGIAGAISPDGSDPDATITAEQPWLVPDDPISSHFLAMLSSLFPHGEEFFVKTVRANRHGIGDDEVLRRQVNAFIGQEAMHGREHRALNDALAAVGYPTEAIDRGTKVVSDKLLKLPGTLPLAVTAAAEHLTGTIAPVFLEHQGTIDVFLSNGDELATLVRWHALEELEHKNVAFDVFERVDGRYWVRALGFGAMLAWYGTYGLTSWIKAVRKDERITARHRRTWLRNVRRQGVVSLRSGRELLGYLKPGFHPDDTDTDELVERWRVRLADRMDAVGASRTGRD